MVKYLLQQINSDEFDLRDEKEQTKDWQIKFHADDIFELAERLIDFINDDEIDSVNSYYRVVDIENEKVIMGVE